MEIKKDPLIVAGTIGSVGSRARFNTTAGVVVFLCAPITGCAGAAGFVAGFFGVGGSALAFFLRFRFRVSAPLEAFAEFSPREEKEKTDSDEVGNAHIPPTYNFCQKGVKRKFAMM